MTNSSTTVNSDALADATTAASDNCYFHNCSIGSKFRITTLFKIGEG